MSSTPRASTTVLVMNQYYPPDTASTGVYAARIASHLADRGHEVVAVVGQPSYRSNSNAAPSRETVDGVEVVRVSLGQRRGRQRLMTRLGGYLRYLVGAYWATRGIKPALVVAFHNPPLLALVARLAARRGSGRMVLVVFDIHPDILVATGWPRLPRPLVLLWDRVNRLLLRTASRVVVLSEGMKDLLVERKRVPADNIEVIPLWAEPALAPTGDDRSWREKAGLNGGLLLLYAGNMGVMHPLEPLLEAMRDLRSTEVSLVVAGDGVRAEEWRRLAVDWGLRRVRFVGFLPGPDFASAVASADAAVVPLGPGLERLAVPSRAYTFMSAGCPVIALMEPQSDLATFVNRHGAGWSASSVEDLVALIQQLSDHPERCQTAGLRAREAYERFHDARHLTRRYGDLTEELAHSRSRPS
jgi:glycosyltransferase involved in cell wall biosynthesis